MSCKLKCIDVSCWQGDIDWAKVKKAGYNIAIIRAGFGREASQVDSKFEQNYKNAKAAGLKLGAYWYSYAENLADAKNEAAACLAVIKDKIFELPVFYDMEESFQTKLGKSTLTSMAKAFMNAVADGGFTAGIYANANWFKNYLDYDFLYNNYYVWLAQYSSEAQFDCHMWQYSSTGTVSGISGGVDMNYIYTESIIGGIKVLNELKKGDKGLNVLNLKYLLQTAADMGVIDFNMTPGNDVYGAGTEKAVKAAQKVLGISQTGVADEGFVNKLYKKIKASYPVKGDYNGDGKVNIKDVTALQRELAGKG